MKDIQYRKIMREIKKLQDEIQRLHKREEVKAYPFALEGVEPPASEAEEEMIGEFMDRLDEAVNSSDDRENEKESKN